MGATIRVNMFGVGSRRRKIQPTATTLREEPHTLRELIEQCVEVCVGRHNRRAENHEPTNPSDEEVDEMAKVGKVAFGIDYNGAVVPLERAVAHALQSYEDGLFRVFCNGAEIQGLDASVVIHEEDVWTFVRLVALSGSMW